MAHPEGIQPAEDSQGTSRQEDFEFRVSQRPPFKEIWGYNDIVEGTYLRDEGYDMAWLVYMGIDEAGNPTEYDEVTRRRYLGDTKPLGEN